MDAAAWNPVLQYGAFGLCLVSMALASLGFRWLVASTAKEREKLAARHEKEREELANRHERERQELARVLTHHAENAQSLAAKNMEVVTNNTMAVKAIIEGMEDLKCWCQSRVAARD